MTYGKLIEFYMTCSIGMERPDLITSNKAAYAYMLERIQAQQRFEQIKDPIRGVETFKFMNASCLVDDYFPSAVYGQNDPDLGDWLTGNVLAGDMSLVGPRPVLPAEAARYADHMRRRLVVKPGITGLWQVNGRSDLAWDEAVRLDLRYVENWSLALDLQILWKTWSAVVRGHGAY